MLEGTTTMRRDFTDRACTFWLDPIDPERVDDEQKPSPLPEIHVMVEANGTARIGIDEDRDGAIRWVEVTAQQLMDISYQFERLSGVAGQLRLAWEYKQRAGRPTSQGQTFTGPDGTVRPLSGGKE